MSFTSFSFAIFFLAVTALYYTLAKKKQWQLLLLASYFFYACADVRYLIFIVITTVSAYLVTTRFTALREKQSAYLKENPDLSKEEKKKYKERMKSKSGKWLTFLPFF